MMLVLLAIWWLIAAKRKFTGGIFTYIVLVVWLVLLICTLARGKQEPATGIQRKETAS